ncbi:MAG: MgtC/SapB family protein, partial [Bacteroidales bacterium]|nr:MgtC/SapB family protein [Bacteroidales bacterium]
MSMALDFTIRLLVAALMGGLIGYERELRGKVAGIRTHLLVAVGSCLFMIISQYGFEGADKFDAARVAAGVAAGVVGGLGFLGGGIIMKNKHVSGLTTAAGIWVTGAIGMALGSGMYELAGFCFVLLLICVEFLYFFTVKLGDMQVNAVLSAKNREDSESA